MQLICVPYHPGRRGVGMGAGPDHLLADGAVDVLGAAGRDISAEHVEMNSPFEHETGAQFAIQRALDDAERRLIRSSGIQWIGPAGLAGAAAEFLSALAGLAARVDSVHVHVDLDVIDPHDGRANEFAAPGGPALDDLDTAIAAIGSYCPVSSVSLTSYNPAEDNDGRALAAGLRLLATLGGLAPA